MYFWEFPCQNYRIYTVYKWFWPILYNTHKTTSYHLPSCTHTFQSPIAQTGLQWSAIVLHHILVNFFYHRERGIVPAFVCGTVCPRTFG